MPTSVIASGIGGISSILGGALAGRQKTQTSTQTMTPNFSPQDQAIMDMLRQYSTASVQNPEASFGPIRGAGYDKINRTYDLAPQMLTTLASRRGMGSSGGLGNAMTKMALSRAQDISGFEGQLAEAQMNRQAQGADLASRMLAMNRGTTTTGTGTTPSTMMSDAFMSGGNALSNLSTIMMLNKILKPQGSPMGGGGGGSPAVPSSNQGTIYGPYAGGGGGGIDMSGGGWG